MTAADDRLTTTFSGIECPALEQHVIWEEVVERGPQWQSLYGEIAPVHSAVTLVQGDGIAEAAQLLSSSIGGRDTQLAMLPSGNDRVVAWAALTRPIEWIRELRPAIRDSARRTSMVDVVIWSILQSYVNGTCALGGLVGFRWKSVENFAGLLFLTTVEIQSAVQSTASGVIELFPEADQQRMLRRGCWLEIEQ